ncbi:DciA family protein [Rhizobiaceae bacterium BDR2-2]|uniref:DciA family protein n=1 Tax=Ectorhizobium quercum TaxID=2965071 RepID=A0AAE3SVP0_9HYPH|nr:DciA family protein [Ectorhizobium quercum]MCX8996406.1 DciA family protein [Ectorhizobium quercum]MCX8998555.1 DciA family protein [Ectorhizobium quercum]
MSYKRRGERPISDIANGIMDPVLARRAGISTALLGSWDEIAGAEFADCTRPEKIVWPRRDDPGQMGGHRPGQLIVACEGARALFLTHAQDELIDRINGFFGYPAIRQIRIVQKPVSRALPLRRVVRPLPKAAEKRLEDMMEGIESEALRAAITRLGKAVLQPGRAARKKTGE